MKSINSYKDLKVWQKAIDLSVEVYRSTVNFPKEEIFGLTAQLRRASNSIALNIAEGYGRGTKGNYVNFLRNARGSLTEVGTAVVLSERLSFLKKNEVEHLETLVEEESKMLTALINKLENGK